MSEASRAVFLSYASQDAEAARRIADSLRASGVEVWFDQSELRGGDAWDQKIRKQIKECALFVPVISANTQSRAEGYFRLEWKLAVDRSHLMADDAPFLFPVVIDDTADASARVPEKFRERQWTRLKIEGTPESLARRIASVLSEEEQAPPARTDRSRAPRGRNDSEYPRWLKYVFIVFGLGMSGFFGIWPMFRHQPNAPAEKRPLSEARQLAERARAILLKGDLTRAQLDTAGELCDRALQLDPTDAIAWAEAAHGDLLLIHPYGYDRSDERRKRAQFRATRALDLAPDVLEVRAMHAAVMAHAGGSPALLAEAEAVFRDLIASHPDDRELVVQLAEVLREQTRFEEAATLFESIGEFEVAGWSYFLAGKGQAALIAVDHSLREKRAVTALQLKAILQVRFVQDLAAAQATLDQLRPSELLSEMQGAGAAEIAMFRRDHERMLQIMRAMPADYLESYAFTGPRQFFIGVAHALAGRTGAAESEWRAGLVLVQERLKSAPEGRQLLLWAAWLQASLGQNADAERLLDRAQDVAGLDRATVDALSVRVFLRLGRNDAVLTWLASELRKKPASWEDTHTRARFDPIYDGLRGDPRFEKLLRENLPEGAKPFPDQKTAQHPPAQLEISDDRFRISRFPRVPKPRPPLGYAHQSARARFDAPTVGGPQQRPIGASPERVEVLSEMRPCL